MLRKRPRGLLIRGLCPLEKEERDDEMGRGSNGRKEGGRRESPMLCSSGDQRPQEAKGGRISEEDRREGGREITSSTYYCFGFFFIIIHQTTSVNAETATFAL